MVSVATAAEIIKNGSVVAYPTEAVYGLGCDPFNEQAVSQLLVLKQRPESKGLILVAANVQQLLPYVQADYLSDEVLKTWPGPITWVMPATDKVPSWIRGEFTSVAVRVSAHQDVQALCLAVGQPIVSTSANIANEPPALNCETVQTYFGEAVACMAGKLGGLDKPTNIKDATTQQVIRH